MAVENGVADSGASTAGGSLDGLKAEANALYLEIQQAALDYEKGTAGAKLAKDKAKAFQS